MGYLFDWISYIPLLFGVAAIVYLPGYLAMRVARFSGAVAVALGPAITFAISGAGAIAFDRVGLPWNLPGFLAASLGVIALAAVLGRLTEPGPIRRFRFTSPALPERKLRQIQCSFGISIVFLVIPFLFLTDPAAPSSQADPMFHYNAVNTVVRTGNASSLGGMAPLYGIEVASVYYPTVWHSILALLGSGTIMPASHTLAYVIIPVMAMTSLLFFVRASLPHHPNAWAIAPIVSLAMPYFPNFLTISRGFWPNSLALAMVPAALSVAVLVVCYATGMHWREMILLGLVFLTALAGIGFAHPGAVFAILWPVFPVVILAGGVALVRSWKDRQLSRSRAFALGGAAFYLAGTALLLSHPRAREFRGRDHPRSWNTRERLETLAGELQAVNPLVIALAVLAAIVLLALLILVVRETWEVPEARWIVIAWFAQWPAVFGAYVDGNIFSSIAGLWYHDPKRIMAVQSIFTGALIALFITRWMSRYPKRSTAIAIATLAVSVAIGCVTRAVSVYPDARPPIGPNNIIDSRAEIELFKELDHLVPPGSVILGDATTGIGYAPSYSDVNVVFPQVNYRQSDLDGRYLRKDFHDIHTDPYVCRILSEYSIGYYYEDDPLVYQKRGRSETWPGLYGVDTSEGFTKIAETDGGTLWRIDACGPIDEPDWWDLEFRAEPRVRLTLPQPDLKRTAKD